MKIINAENRMIAGNYYDKYSTNNPLARLLMKNYLSNLDCLIDQISPVSIHEVGCGEGNLIIRYRDGKRTLTGSDLSQHIIQMAQDRNSSSGIKFKVASIYELTEIDSANCILCCEVLEHLDHPVKALEILESIAKPYLIVSVPREPIWRVLNLLRGAYITHLGNTPGHFQHWSKIQIIKTLEKRFNIVSVKTPFPWTMVLCSRKLV